MFDYKIFIFFLQLSRIAFSLKAGYLKSVRTEGTIVEDCLQAKNIEVLKESACEDFNGLDGVVNLQHHQDVDIFIGETCEHEGQTISRLTERWGKLFLSTQEFELNEKGKTTVVTNRNTTFALERGLEALIVHLNWTHIGIVHSSGLSSKITSISQYLTSKTGGYVVNICELDSYSCLQVLSSSIRVILFVGSFDDYLIFISSISELVEIPAEYVTLFVDFGQSDPKNFYRFTAKYALQIENRWRIRKIIKNTLLLTTPVRTREAVKRAAYNHNVQNMSNFDLESLLQLCDVLNQRPYSFDELVNRSFYGNLGHFYINSNGILIPDYEVHYFDGTNETLVVTLFGDPRPRQVLNLQGIPMIMDMQAIDRSSDWTQNLPPSIPNCGFDGSLCSNRLIYLAVAAILCVLSVPLGFAWYVQKKEHQLQQMAWRIAHDEVTFSSSIEMASSATSEKLRLSSFRANSVVCSVFGPSVGDMCQTAQVFGKKVTVKSYFQRRPIDISRDDMEHLNTLHSIIHPNINPFIGIAFDSSSELLVLWTFCTRHSLEDLFFIKEHKLGRNFLASFLRQILRGLHYIHNCPIRCHGALFLSNCVVDSYWVVKLTDFGIRPFIKEKIKQKDIYELPIMINDLPRSLIDI